MTHRQAQENPGLSKRQVARLRKLAAQRLEERRRRPRLLPPDPRPRYDDLWEQAMAQLGSSIDPEDALFVDLR
jgi:hypothetical protein